MHGVSYHFARFIYRNLRKAKNRGLNAINRPIVILTYHRVTTLRSDPQLLAVTPSNFRDQLQYLKNHYRIVRFEEDWSHVKQPAVAITFDDGYADNLLEALPLLEEAGVPATFFLSTGTIGSRREFWWDELERVILAEKHYPTRFRLKGQRYEKVWPTKNPAQRLVLYCELQLLMMRIDCTQREAWLEQLRLWGGFDAFGREQNRPLSHYELQNLAKSNLATIGAHTITHTPLAGLTEEQQRNEILFSKKELEKMIASEVRVFSYPFGRKKDYSARSARICREAGFVKAAANFPGQVHSWTDPYQLPRQLVRNWDLKTFTAKLKGFWIS